MYIKVTIAIDIQQILFESWAFDNEWLASFVEFIEIIKIIEDHSVSEAQINKKKFRANASNVTMNRFKEMQLLSIIQQEENWIILNACALKHVSSFGFYHNKTDDKFRSNKTIYKLVSLRVNIFSNF